jgi:hypothetical protein
MNKFFPDANHGLRLLVGDKDIASARSPEAASRIQEMIKASISIAQDMDAGKNYADL